MLEGVRKSFAAAVALTLFAVAAVSASPALAGEMVLVWDPVSDADLDGYRVYYGTTPGSYTQSQDAGGSTSATLTGLDACTTYYTAIKAYDTGGLESNNYSNEVSGLPRPVVTTVAPNSGEQGQSLTLAISGESFGSGATVEFSGTGITVTDVRVLGCNNLEADITIALGASLGARDVDVVNADRSYGRSAGGFTVTANAAPSVSSTFPVAGATDVAVDVSPTVTFSEAMNSATITASNVQLLDASGTPVPQAAGSPTLSGDGQTATIDPASDLDADATYRIFVNGGAGGVQDASGQTMASDYTQTPGFTTSTAPDTQGPSVVATSPTDGQTNVTVSVTATVTFDEPLDPASVTTSTVQLLDASGTPVPQAGGSPSLNGSRTVVSIVPASPLDENATYRIRVIGGPLGVRDDAGNAMDSTFTHTTGFTTENLPPGTVSGLARDDVK